MTACLPLSAAPGAVDDILAPRTLSPSAWEMARATRGVVFGGRAGLEPTVQIICDVHCPYCARVYARLGELRPGLRVRWVPIAYFKPDSDRVAAAILSSRDPVASLDQNYRSYDAAQRRGGFSAGSGRAVSLDASHAALKRRWKEWGRFTPMVMVRTTDGTILQASGSTPAFLDPVLDRAAPARQAYEAW
ncbi:hypothetical protein [Marilutibacter aestuarii]|uniref:Thioredoxin-like fold domain-containing protein n=1 Tax=Marilutibacter aestuarii TaxID=1706195 RepID=A0A508AF18_9GAMM|nr:hypothetical protein [Lysobacter aestuarii]TQD45685.1 hypothetical protein FKV25_07600 [Lysobacter aestuarii]